MGSRIHRHYRDTEHWKPHHKDLSCFLFMIIPICLSLSHLRSLTFLRTINPSPIANIFFFSSKVLHKYYHTICNLFGLAFFIQPNSLKIQFVHSVQNSFSLLCISTFHSFLLLSNIAGYVYFTVFHTWFNHLLGEGHLGWVPFEAFTYEAAMNISCAGFCMGI